MEGMDNRTEVSEFLRTRRARISPEQVGIITGAGHRRVPGLRREEVALMAGVRCRLHLPNSSRQLSVPRAVEWTGPADAAGFEYSMLAGVETLRVPVNKSIVRRLRWLSCENSERLLWCSGGRSAIPGPILLDRGHEIRVRGNDQLVGCFVRPDIGEIAGATPGQHRHQHRDRHASGHDHESQR